MSEQDIHEVGTATYRVFISNSRSRAARLGSCLPESDRYR
jgi:hypothetical protein